MAAAADAAQGDNRTGNDPEARAAPGVALHHSGVPRTNAKGEPLDGHGNVWQTGNPDDIDWVSNEGIRTSRLVVFPTGTVYGLGCDAFDEHAVRNLVDAKGRGRGMPLSVLVGSWSTVDGLVLSVPKRARDLIEQAAAYSGAADDELLSQRIAEQEAQLDGLTRRRAVLASATRNQDD